MGDNPLYRLSAGDEDHEIAHSAAASPVAGALLPLEEDLGSSCGEVGSFGIVSYHTHHDPTQSGHRDGTWPGLEVASSPGSSSSSVFTPVEDMSSPPAYALSPTSNAPFPPPILHNRIDRIQALAGEGGMQSPASYYPASPSDGLTDSDVHEAPPSSTASSPIPLHHSDGANMDATSAPRSMPTTTSRLQNGDRPYAQLLRECFLSRADHSMSLKDIYKWFEQNTNKWRQSGSGKGWQNSIRHNLSMNAAFKKQDVTHAHLTDRGVPRSRSNVWTMEQWAVDGPVQSTTRYRRSNTSRRTTGRRQIQHHNQHHTQNYGVPNYMLAGSEQSYGQGMGRAGAGRRGGVATRFARERELQEQRRTQYQQRLANMSHPVSVVELGNTNWTVPRACSPEMIAGFPMPDQFRMPGAPHGVHAYMGMQGSVNMAPQQQMFGHQLPGSPGSQAAAAQMSPSQVQQQLQGQQQLQSQQVHQQHNGAYTYGSSGGTVDYTNGHGGHSAQ